MARGRPKTPLGLGLASPTAEAQNEHGELLQRQTKAGRAYLAKRLGEIFREERARRHVTAEAVAEAIGISRATLSTWENGHALPDVFSLFLIVQCLDLSLDVLAHGEETASSLWYARFADKEEILDGSPIVNFKGGPDATRDNRVNEAGLIDTLDINSSPFLAEEQILKLQQEMSELRIQLEKISKPSRILPLAKKQGRS